MAGSAGVVRVVEDGVERHRPFREGTGDTVLTELLSQGDAAGLIEWEVPVDSTANRAHQNATNLALTGGSFE